MACCRPARGGHITLLFNHQSNKTARVCGACANALCPQRSQSAQAALLGGGAGVLRRTNAASAAAVASGSSSCSAWPARGTRTSWKRPCGHTEASSRSTHVNMSINLRSGANRACHIRMAQQHAPASAPPSAASLAGPCPPAAAASAPSGPKRHHRDLCKRWIVSAHDLHAGRTFAHTARTHA